MTKTLRVDLADLEGIPHASGPSGTSVVVTAEYTSPVVLEADGKIILAPKSKTMGAAGRVDFTGIYTSDGEEVREDHRGFALRVKVDIREPNGATRTWARTVKPLEHMADTIRLGRMPSAQGLPPQWTTVGEVLNDVTAVYATVDNLTATATALPPGSNPTVTVTGPIPNKVINIGVPRGADGAPGMGYEEGQQLLAQNASTLTAAQQAVADAETAMQAQFLTQDEGVAALIETSAGPNTRAALDAYAASSFAVARSTIGPGAAGLAAGVVARNAAETPLPDMLGLLDGDTPGGQLASLANQTITTTPSPTNPAMNVKHVVGTGVTNLSVRRTLPATTDGSPPNCITQWVYLPDPSIVDYVRVVLICSGGTWTRQSNQNGSSHFGSDGETLQRGWNRVRIAAHAASPGYTHLNAITQVRAEVFFTSSTNGQAYFGPTVIERRPKASIVIINDWGSKPFLDNAYPDLVANDFPCSWAIRPNLLGGGSYPNNFISWNEVHALAADGNRNHISMHSYQGEATSGMSAAECLNDTLNAQAYLSVEGLFGEDSVHRLAWTQNQAPNAHGAFGQLATSGTWSASASIVPWPPFRRHDIARLAIHDQGSGFMDSTFTMLQDTREAALFYTHGVVPDAHDAPHHATQTEWNYFMGKLTDGVAAGWLEVVTIPQLVARDRLTLPLEPPA